VFELKHAICTKKELKVPCQTAHFASSSDLPSNPFEWKAHWWANKVCRKTGI